MQSCFQQVHNVRSKNRHVWWENSEKSNALVRFSRLRSAKLWLKSFLGQVNLAEGTKSNCRSVADISPRWTH